MKLPTAEEMFEETVQKVSSSPEEWLKFLNTASRVYQYDFDDQLMIYAQRPNAVGCTSFEKWKEMGYRRNCSYPDCGFTKKVKICL